MASVDSSSQYKLVTNMIDGQLVKEQEHSVLLLL
jgi:hypothetical protein